jgi:hypothetical protein
VIVSGPFVAMPAVELPAITVPVGPPAVFVDSSRIADLASSGLTMLLRI